MNINGWKYYNHAVIPDTPPHITPNTKPIEDGSIWNIKEKPLLARWTTDFDCGYETNWWYVIKDDTFDVSLLKAKRRYEINKGIKNFEVIEINPLDYKEELYDIQIAAYSDWPEKYRPKVDKHSFIKDIYKWDGYIVIGAFYRETMKLCGYALLKKTDESCIEFNVLRVNPIHEKNSINFALVEGILRHFKDFISNGGYICDGARSINHETAFQDFLEKYFIFRKAYCKLSISYQPKIKMLIKIIYVFRKILLKFDQLGIVHQLNSILRMEEIVRKDNE